MGGSLCRHGVAYSSMYMKEREYGCYQGRNHKEDGECYMQVFVGSFAANSDIKSQGCVEDSEPVVTLRERS